MSSNEAKQRLSLRLHRNTRDYVAVVFSDQGKVHEELVHLAVSCGLEAIELNHEEDSIESMGLSKLEQTLLEASLAVLPD